MVTLTVLLLWEVGRESSGTHSNSAKGDGNLDKINNSNKTIQNVLFAKSRDYSSGHRVRKIDRRSHSGAKANSCVCCLCSDIVGDQSRHKPL